VLLKLKFPIFDITKLHTINLVRLSNFDWQTQLHELTVKLSRSHHTLNALLRTQRWEKLASE